MENPLELTPLLQANTAEERRQCLVFLHESLCQLLRVADSVDSMPRELQHHDAPRLHATVRNAQRWRDFIGGLLQDLDAAKGQEVA